MGAVSGAPLAIRQNTGKTEEWFPGACHPSEYRKDGGVVSRTRLGNHSTPFLAVHLPRLPPLPRALMSTHRQAQIVDPPKPHLSAVQYTSLANTDFPYTSLRSLKCAKNGALSTVPL
ncbi:hypothetical protein KXW60_005789 [Aspergillus fumigatus]|nr:hypothetical protein KXW60_005789 [Aspergillus fumigatus]